MSYNTVKSNKLQITIFFLTIYKFEKILICKKLLIPKLYFEKEENC